NDKIKQLFYREYGDLSYLLDVKVDKYLFQALAQVQVDKAYSKVANVPAFLKRLMNITGMSEQWVTTQIKQKEDSKCIPWKSLRNLILPHPNERKRVDVFALSIYGLVIFSQSTRACR
ncbi:hypothetical protein Golax_005756, partial [Gossypium laxum]|nr:hypothetical protein [Gossypium laxum]